MATYNSLETLQRCVGSGQGGPSYSVYCFLTGTTAEIDLIYNIDGRTYVRTTVNIQYSTHNICLSSIEIMKPLSRALLFAYSS